MPTSSFHHLLMILIVFFHFNLSFSSLNLILPLKTKINSVGSLLTSPSKFSFHHNVTLTVTLTVGTPPQKVSMVIDTGSELSWLHCNKNKKTFVHNSTFLPTHSSSYKSIPCSSTTCTDQTRDFSSPASCDMHKLCHVILSYADASSSEGNLALETFNIENLRIPGMVFGCMDLSFSSSTSEEDSKTTGLLGMNMGSLSFVSQMGFQKFSYCISDNKDSTGVLLLGDGGASKYPLNYTPLIRISSRLPYFDRVAYTVQLEGIRVSNKLLPLPKSVFVPDHTGAGQTMVDSGTQFTFLLGPVYTELRREFLYQTKRVLRVLDEPNFVFQGTMDLCFRVPSSRTKLPPLPTVSMIFRGAEITVSGDKLLYRVMGEVRGNDSVYCMTFGNSDLLGLEAYVIGHHHQQNLWVEFDLAKSRVGFSSFIKCDIIANQILDMGPTD